MHRLVRTLGTLALSVLIASAGLLLPGPPNASAQQGDRLPNLQMIRLRDWHVQRVNGRRLLRFSTIFVNAGRGPFELRGGRASTSDPTMDMDQLIYRTDGTARRRNTPAIARYAGDGHDHWHVQGVVTYEAWMPAQPATTRRGAKTGFCFFDTTAWNLSLPRARQSSYYRQEWCGTRAVLTNRVGVSVGWGDRYPWNFAYQWIDITGLPGGTYRVRATVDIQDFYDEAIEADNCVWAKIKIPAPGSGAQPVVYDRGNDCGRDAITAVSSFAGGEVFAPPRNVSVTAGKHVGYTFNSRGTTLRRRSGTVPTPRSFTASARAVPPGQSGSWLYMASGQFAGYWLRESSGVKLEP
jgi:hypothetical protein